MRCAVFSLVLLLAPSTAAQQPTTRQELPSPVRHDASRTDAASFGRSDGLPHGDVRAILSDRRGDLWFGTKGGGLARLTGGKWTRYSQADGLASDGVAALCEASDGAIWTGGLGGVSRFDGEEWAAFSRELGDGVRVVFSVHCAPDGALWFGTNRGAVRHHRGSWKRFTTDDGLPHDVVHAVLVDRRGTTWFGTRKGGLVAFDGESWTRHLPDRNIRSLLEDADGKLWAGTSGAGVAVWDGETWQTHFAGHTVLPSSLDSRGNVWCTVEGRGALRFNGERWFAYGTESALISDAVQAVAEDGERRLWFATAAGVTRLAKKARKDE